MGRGFKPVEPGGFTLSSSPERVEIIGHLSEQGLVNVEPHSAPNF
jgi:hypothetical protein